MTSQQDSVTLDLHIDTSFVITLDLHADTSFVVTLDLHVDTSFVVRKYAERHKDIGHNTITQFLVSLLWSILPQRSKGSGPCFHLLPLLVYKFPPPSFSSSSFSVSLLYTILGGFKSKFLSLWQRNPSSVYVHSTSISTV